MNVLHVFRSVEFAPTLLALPFPPSLHLCSSTLIFRLLPLAKYVPYCEIKMYSPEINFYVRWYQSYKSGEIIDLDLDVSIMRSSRNCREEELNEGS